MGGTWVEQQRETEDGPRKKRKGSIPPEVPSNFSAVVAPPMFDRGAVLTDSPPLGQPLLSRNNW